MREIAGRGLMYVDDGASLRSRAGEVAAAKNTAFAKADLVIDAVATPDDIAGRLAQLEQIARTRGLAVGVASALPVSVRTIGEWAGGLEQRGIVLVPVSAAIGRTGPSAGAAASEPLETGAPATSTAGTADAVDGAVPASDGDGHGDGH
jgi:polysaccharide deacetylase 2 family uncharacterized protein YibQ